RGCHEVHSEELQRGAAEPAGAGGVHLEDAAMKIEDEIGNRGGLEQIHVALGNSSKIPEQLLAAFATPFHDNPLPSPDARFCRATAPGAILLAPPIGSNRRCCGR